MTQEENEVRVFGVRPDADYSGVPNAISIQEGQVTNTVATDSTEAITIRPPSGEMWLLRSLGCWLHTGTAGTRVEAQLYDGTQVFPFHKETDSDVDFCATDDLLITNNYYIRVAGHNPDTANTHDLIVDYVAKRVK